MFKTEQELMEELVESIYSGNVGGDESEKDEKEEETEDKTEETTETSEKEESGEETEDEGEESEESGEEDEDEGEESEEGESEESGEDEDSDGDFGGDTKDGAGSKGGPFTSKIRTLQKQYNDLLIDAFEKYAPECIEDALDETKSAFGENIEDILQSALDKLKAKIMGDLGVEGSSDIEGMPPAAMGSFDPAAGADKPMEISIDKVG